MNMATSDTNHDQGSIRLRQTNASTPAPRVRHVDQLPEETLTTVLTLLEGETRVASNEHDLIEGETIVFTDYYTVSRS
ncbi:hypothetical protein OB919_13770 [Halobacteria archaeon AArc-curdl1]|uniref:Uncharacterized protein n=1 Tax=Natronosalvus hydrolyticus TaxID=2979988 RepID=A0AAP2Z964_9EURY|nr:hypothetical protein [Halobacteria archaeon AArc-curdl1]